MTVGIGSDGSADIGVIVTEVVDSERGSEAGFYTQIQRKTLTWRFFEAVEAMLGTKCWMRKEATVEGISPLFMLSSVFLSSHYHYKSNRIS